MRDDNHSKEMNRLKEYFGEPPEPESQDDYHELHVYGDVFAVSAETAREAERALAHRPPPKWFVFQDLTGAWHRRRTDSIAGISESKAEQRAKGREFNRARRLEEKKDRRPWEDDDY